MAYTDTQATARANSARFNKTPIHWIFLLAAFSALTYWALTNHPSLFPGSLTQFDIFTLMGVNFACAFITVACGIGGGTVALAMMANILPAAAIIPVHGMTQFGTDLGRTAIFAKFLHTAPLLPFIIGCLIGIAVGGSIAVELPAQTIQLCLGGFILIVLVFDLGKVASCASTTGLVSSFLTMFVGASGTLVGCFVKSGKLDAQSHTALFATCMTVQHFIKTVFFIFAGFAFAEWMVLIGLMVAFGLIGTVMGKTILMKIDEQFFQRAVSAILALLSARLITGGLLG